MDQSYISNFFNDESLQNSHMSLVKYFLLYISWIIFTDLFSKYSKKSKILNNLYQEINSIFHIDAKRIEMEECVICYNTIEQEIVLDCGHPYCGNILI